MTNASEFVRCVGFDAANNKWYNDCGDYMIDAAGAAVPGALFALVLGIAAALYVLAHCCGLLRCICRGCKPSREGAPAQAVWLHRALVCATVVALMVVAGASTASNRSLRSSLDGAKGDLRGVESETQAAADNVLASVRAFVESTEPTTTGWTLLGHMQHAHDEVDGWTDTMRDVEENLTRYLWSIDAVLWLVAVVLLGFATTTLLNVHRVVPPLAFCVVLVVGLCVMCLQVAAGITSEFVDSACAEQPDVLRSLDGFFAADRYRDNQAVTVLAQLPQNVDVVYAEAMCRGYVPAQELCTSAFYCPVSCTSAQSVAEFLARSSLRESAGRGSCAGQCTILECAAACEEGSSVKRLAMEVARTAETYGAASSAASLAGTKIVDAELFTAGLRSVFSSVCAGGASSSLEKLSRLLAAASALVGTAGVLVCLATYIYRGKRSDEREVIVVSEVPNYSTQQPDDAVVYGQALEYKTLPPTDVEANVRAKEAAL